MATTTRDLVEVVSSGIAALDGWTVSRWPAGLFGRDTTQLMSKSFAVGAPETAPEAREVRQIPAQGMWSATVLEVEWAYRLRAKEEVGDYLAALDAELALVGAVMGITSQAATIQRITRRTVDGWVLGLVRFSLPHRYSLTGLPPSP